MIQITAGRLTVPCLAIAGITEPSTRTLTTPAPSRNRSIRILPMTRIVTSHYRYKRPLILLVALMLTACSGAVVRPNPTNPAYMGVYAPVAPAGATAVLSSPQHSRHCNRS